MKKYLILVIVTLVVFAGIKVADARINNNDGVVSLSQQNDDTQVHMVVAAETTATSTILADLSDVTNFPHSRTVGSLEVSQIRVDFTTDVVATTTLKFGVLASSTASGANVDVYWFDEVSFVSSDLTGSNFTGRQQKTLNYSPSTIKLALSGTAPLGAVSKFKSNDSTLYTTTYATTTKLLSPNGYISPGRGDLVMQVYDQKGTATSTVSVIYREVE